MRLTCPSCGSLASLESWLMDDDARHMLADIAGLPEPLPRLAVRYLGAFRDPKSVRGLSWTKARRLVNELAGLVRSEDIQWDGKRILQNKSEFWTEALTVILDKDAAGTLKRPLSNHNLLRTIAYGVADQAAEAGLRQKESNLRSGRREEVRPSAQEPRDSGPSESQRMYEELKAKRAEAQPETFSQPMQLQDILGKMTPKIQDMSDEELQARKDRIKKLCGIDGNPGGTRS